MEKVLLSVLKKEYGLVTCDLAGNALAMQLGEEFEDHLKA